MSGALVRCFCAPEPRRASPSFCLMRGARQRLRHCTWGGTPGRTWDTQGHQNLGARSRHHHIFQDYCGVHSRSLSSSRPIALPEPPRLCEVLCLAFLLIPFRIGDINVLSAFGGRGFRFCYCVGDFFSTEKRAFALPFRSRRLSMSCASCRSLAQRPL